MSYFQIYHAGPMRGVFSRYICPGEPRRGPWISVGLHSLTQTHFSPHFVVAIFNSNPKFGEESQPVPRASKQSCSTLQNVSWSPWYHGKNKLHFYEMMSALYWTNPLSWIFIVLAHWKFSTQVDMSLHYDNLSWLGANQTLIWSDFDTDSCVYLLMGASRSV